jgi:hypothetical protein
MIRYILNPEIYNEEGKITNMSGIQQKPDAPEFEEIKFSNEFSLDTYSQKILFENLNYLGKLNKNIVFSANLFNEDISSFMIEVAGRLAQEFVRQGILSDKDFIIELVKIISNIQYEEKIEISVNPQNYSLMKTIIPELNKSLKGHQNLDVICDENITLNNFKVECGSMIFDEDLLGKIRKLINILRHSNKLNSKKEIQRFDNDGILKKQIRDLKYISGFDLLSDIDSEIIADIIQNEHPQTISLILKMINENKADEILEKIPAEMKDEINLRKSQVQKVPQNVIEEVETNIYRLFGNEMFEKFSMSNGKEYINTLLNLLTPSEKTKLLQGFKEYNQSMFEKIDG